MLGEAEPRQKIDIEQLTKSELQVLQEGLTAIQAFDTSVWGNFVDEYDSFLEKHTKVQTILVEKRRERLAARKALR